jgi:uncharacterized BrkB/YihY/UPF0761 family membrane protein
MMWMWMSAIIVLYGAELNSEIERQAMRDIGVGRPAETPAPAVPAVAKEH